MADQEGEAAAPERPFGLTPSRVRGFIAVLVLFIGIYAILFESEPPPVFEEVDINIPDRPEPDFDERSIVLPEFEPSPEEEGAEAAEGVEITTTEAEDAPEPQPVGQGETAEAPAEIAPEEAPAEEPAAAPEPEAEPEPVAAEEEPAPEGAQPPAPETAPSATSGYYVQIAALKSQEAASALSEKVGSGLEVPTYVESIRRGGDVLYRVRLGPFGDDEARARNTLNRLRELDASLGANSYVDFE